MDWIQAVTIIGVLGGFMIFMLQRIEKDINRLEISIDGNNRRLDQRIDQLFKIIVDLLQAKK